MIDYIDGVLKSKNQDSAVIEACGIGYKIFITPDACGKLPVENSQVKLYIVENAAGMYGGVINLYGFLTVQERNMYILIKDYVPSTGAKKALEYLDKISKSFADFKAAVSKKDAVALSSTFTFTRKTADKIISALKEKISEIPDGEYMPHSTKISIGGTDIAREAVSALISLGYKEIQAEEAVRSAYKEDENISLSDLIKKSLKFV